MTIQAFFCITLLLFRHFNVNSSLLFELESIPTTYIQDQKGIVAYTLQSSSDQKQFQISPLNPSASWVQFIFQSVAMRNTELSIFDSADSKAGITLYTCASCGSIPAPPPFYSRTGTIMIQILGTLS